MTPDVNSNVMAEQRTLELLIEPPTINDLNLDGTPGRCHQGQCKSRIG